MYFPTRRFFWLFFLLPLLVAYQVEARVELISNMTDERVANPGDVYRGTIGLRNTGPSQGEAKLYQTDYSFSASGENDYGEKGQLPRSNANWISLSREIVTIPPNGIAQVEYELKVPDSAGLSGTYWSMIMVEPIGEDSAESAGDAQEKALALRQIIRFGIQVVTQVGKAGKSALVFTNPTLLPGDEGNKRSFAIDVENTGERWLKPGLWLELYSHSGTPIGKFESQARRLYPNTSARFRFDLGQIASGKYLGLVVADGTGDNLFGANVELEIE